MNVNTPIQIFIAYNNNEYYPFQNDKWTGYRALPIGFIETVLNNVSSEEWAVFTTLCVRYRYWQTKPSQDSMGNIYYKLFWNIILFQAWSKQEKLQEEKITSWKVHR